MASVCPGAEFQDWCLGPPSLGIPGLAQRLGDNPTQRVTRGEGVPRIARLSREPAIFFER